MEVFLDKMCIDFRKRALTRFKSFSSNNFLDKPDFSNFNLSSLNDRWFRGFMTHPQISSTLNDAIYYSFLASGTKNNCPYATQLLNNVCNWCIEIIQNYYNTGDDEAAAFRHFWDLLTAPPSNLQESFHPIEWKYYEEKFLKVNCRRVKEKLEKEIQQDFIREDPNYIKVLHKYNCALKSCFQMAFIYLLGEFKFNDFYIPPALLEKNQNSRLPLTLKSEENQGRWKNIFDENDILYVIGVPGSGKSLFLRNLVNNYSDMSFFDSQNYLVIYCDMKSYYSNGNSNKKSILDFLQETIINTTGMDSKTISKDFIHYYLHIGHCIVLMDALDEVSKDKRVDLHKKVVSYFKTSHPNNKVCITSRARGFFPQEDIKVFYISELTSEDISIYLDHMIDLGKFKREDKNRFLTQAQVLINKHFLTNFLTLSLMVNIYKAERELPENKIELYKKCFEYIAKKREMEKGSKSSYDWDKVSLLMKDSTFISLATLAAPNNTGISREKIENMLMERYSLKYNDEATTEYAIQQFLDFCSSRTDLFVLADTDDKFKFFHRSFFEYFYSRYITQQVSIEEMYNLMSQFDEDSEVFELVIALIKEENEQKYQELIKYIFNQITEEVQSSDSWRTAFMILTSSMQVIDDAYFRNKYMQFITENPNLMISKVVQSMNQDAISLAIQKCFQTCPDYISTFSRNYKISYISFIVSQFESISPKSIDSIPNTSDILMMKFTQAPHYILSRLSPFSIPFFVYVYPDANSLQREMIQWSESEISVFLSNIPKSKEKRKIIKAFNSFKKYTIPQRKKFFELFFKYDCEFTTKGTVIIPENHSLT